jgi:demethylmenaquinone methyltransferase/2-methoxy-6-polyprenyl-1,4-benzoquinol methylase
MKVDHLNSTATDVLPVRQTRRQTRRFYDRIAPFYDILSERTEWPVRHRALAVLHAQPGERILEIGPGTGHNLVALARAVAPHGHVHGLDFSEAMLAHARTLIQRSDLSDRVTLRWGDAVNLPYLNHTMDGVLMTFTLELFDTAEMPVALTECRRVLRPGGRIVVASLTKDADASVIQRLLEWTHVHLPQVVDCRPIHARQALADAGFRIVSAEVVHAWVPVEVVSGNLAGESEKRRPFVADPAALPYNSDHAPV